MPNTNATERGKLDHGNKIPAKSHKRPPLFVSDEKGMEHDSMYSHSGQTSASDKGGFRLPHIFALILPLSACIAGALVSSAYNIRWLMMVSCVLGGVLVAGYFISSRRRDRYRSMSDEETMNQQVADYRRDLMKTLEGYDVDRGMTKEEIDALVDEYRHHLEVENASLMNLNIGRIVASVFRRGKGDSKKGEKKHKKNEKKRAGRGELSEG